MLDTQGIMVNAFSFCLYGPPNPRYYTPLVENIKIALTHFAGWQVWIHYAPDVDTTYLLLLKSYSNVVLQPTHILGPANMITRFYTIDHPEVDLMIVRDADSLIHWKDRWAIQRFVERSDCIAHTIRDHRDHGTRIMGGLWGIRKSTGLRIQDQYQQYLQTPTDFGVAHDQNFLSGQIYPQVFTRMLVHYSHGHLYPGEHGEEFPFAWSDTTYCGKVEFPTEPVARLVNGRFTTRVR
jgi:hypothetical protein